MPRLLLVLTLLSVTFANVGVVFSKVYHIRRAVDGPSVIALEDSVPMETEQVDGSSIFGDGSIGGRFKRATDNDKLNVTMSVLPDEGHNEAIVHWSGSRSLVSASCTCAGSLQPRVKCGLRIVQRVKCGLSGQKYLTLTHTV